MTVTAVSTPQHRSPVRPSAGYSSLLGSDGFPHLIPCVCFFPPPPFPVYCYFRFVSFLPPFPSIIVNVYSFPLFVLLYVGSLFAPLVLLRHFTSQ